MKKIWTILSVLCLMMGIFIAPVQAQEAFTIDDLDIHIRVAEDGTYTIEERYVMNFTSQRHGFYRTIPTKFEMKWTDPESGKASYRTYYFPVDQTSCGKATCETSVDNGGVIIKIGDPDKTVIGEQHYTISYQVHTKDLDYQDTQMLYWNLIGNGFDTTVRNMHYTIEMPKDFDASAISAYSGGYGAADQNLSVNVEGTTISGDLLQPLSNYEAATIMVNLPSDYFTFPEAPDYLLYAILFTAIITIISVILFYRFGKDDEVVVTVEFKAPDGLDSAAVGYIADATVDNKDILSLIIDWANRGYINIHDEEDHHMKLEKRKDMDQADTTPYERAFFDAIFKNKDIVDEEDLKESHVGNGLSNAKTMLSNYFHTKKRRVFTSSSVGLQFFMSVMVALPTAVCLFAASYAHYGMLEMTWPSAVIGVFGLLAALPWVLLMRKRYVMKKTNFFILWGLCFLVNAIIFTVAAFTMILWGPGFAWLYALLYMGMQILQLLILMFMDKRTQQGNRWLGQILGLRDFILNCEKDRLELLVEENPSAFYDVLPFAYVLGVSDVWAKKFEHLIVPQPEWYSSNTYYGSGFSTWIWWGYFHRSFHNVSNAATYVETKGGSSGIGGGSIGGGFSGGGFSGGGFGGGGGGSW